MSEWLVTLHFGQSKRRNAGVHQGVEHQPRPHGRELSFVSYPEHARCVGEYANEAVGGMQVNHGGLVDDQNHVFGQWDIAFPVWSTMSFAMVDEPSVPTPKPPQTRDSTRPSTHPCNICICV